jgi:hypothetical protein
MGTVKSTKAPFIAGPIPSWGGETTNLSAIHAATLNLARCFPSFRIMLGSPSDCLNTSDDFRLSAIL